MSNEYLAFVNEMGTDMEGKPMYTLHFTTDTESVWGNYFNVAPASLANNLSVDENCITSRATVTTPRKVEIAARNNCFSMQDCIDGIIPMMFSPIDEETLMIGETPFSILFGEPFDEVERKLSSIGVEMKDIETVEHGDNSAVDKLIESMDNPMNNEDDNFDIGF